MATRTLPDPDPSRLGRRVVFELSEQELPLLDAAEARHGTKRAGIVAALAAEAGAAEREARLAEAERQREAALEALGSAPCRKTAHRRRRDGAKRRALVRLVEADARQFLAGLPSESVDLIVTDPPYHFARGKTYFRVWFAELPDEVWSAILAELHRVLRRDRHAYVFCNRRMHPLLERAAHGAGFRVHPPLIWDKDRLGLGSGPWRSSYELILFLEKGRRAGNHKTLRSVLRARAPVRRFPTEKPVEVLGTLIGQASRVGELVLDPFCGSGSVGQAARALGRRVLLCDVNAGLCRAQVTSRPDGPGGHGSGT